MHSNLLLQKIKCANFHWTWYFCVSLLSFPRSVLRTWRVCSISPCLWTRQFSWSKMSSSQPQKEMSTPEMPFGSVSSLKRALKRSLYHYGKTREENNNLLLQFFGLFHIHLAGFSFLHLKIGVLIQSLLHATSSKNFTWIWFLYWRSVHQLHLHFIISFCFPFMFSLSHFCRFKVILDQHSCSETCLDAHMLCYSFYILNKCMRRNSVAPVNRTCSHLFPSTLNRPMSAVCNLFVWQNNKMFPNKFP